MPYELHISAGNLQYKVFLQSGFFEHTFLTPFIHKHNYAEIHLFSGGSGIFRVEDQLLTLSDGDMLVIPGNSFHCCQHKEKAAMHAAFQLDCKISEAVQYTLPAGLCASFLAEIKSCLISTDYTGVAGYISLLCRYLSGDMRLGVQPVTDYGFLIHEFFANHYSADVQLKDLAAELHLSQRQAERLVIEHTGRTFREELAHTRVEMACFLLRSSTISRTEAAQYVGYHSYAGFWKAMKKFGQQPYSKSSNSKKL